MSSVATGKVNNTENARNSVGNDTTSHNLGPA